MDTSIKTRWHLEVTSRCTLACPKCPRTANPKQHNIDLDIDSIKKFFDKDLISRSDILFCGNYGDPIYHPRFHDIIKYFIDNNINNIRITTNGYGRSLEWWNELGDLLRPQDSLAFSVDGLSDTNHLYRVNSKWDNVYRAMETMAKKDVGTGWKFIVFKHNQHQIEEAKEMAKTLGFDRFNTVKSGRWNAHDDPLRPDEQWVNTTKRFEDILEPKCMTGTARRYVSATGYYSPCCWFPDKSAHDNGYFDQEDFNIKTHSFEEIINSTSMKEFNKTLTNIATAPRICTKMCKKNVSEADNGRQVAIIGTDFNKKT